MGTPDARRRRAGGRVDPRSNGAPRAGAWGAIWLAPSPPPKRGGLRLVDSGRLGAWANRLDPDIVRGDGSSHGRRRARTPTSTGGPAREPRRRHRGAAPRALRRAPIGALSCKGRGFCPRCSGRRMNGTARPHVDVGRWERSGPWGAPRDGSRSSPRLRRARRRRASPRCRAMARSEARGRGLRVDAPMIRASGGDTRARRSRLLRPSRERSGWLERDRALHPTAPTGEVDGTMQPRAAGGPHVRCAGGRSPSRGAPHGPRAWGGRPWGVRSSSAARQSRQGSAPPHGGARAIATIAGVDVGVWREPHDPPGEGVRMTERSRHASENASQRGGSVRRARGPQSAVSHSAAEVTGSSSARTTARASSSSRIMSARLGPTA